MSGTDRAQKQAKTAGPTVCTLVTTLLLNISSTTEPIRHPIGSVVELEINMFNHERLPASIAALGKAPRVQAVANGEIVLEFLT
jgi:hypothetical protein